MMTNLSPSEFDALREAQSSREDNPKKITQTVAWASDKPLIDAMPDNLNFNQMTDNEFSNYKVVDVSGFVPVNGEPNVCMFTPLVGHWLIQTCYCLNSLPAIT